MKNQVEIIKEILKYGFSAAMATAGITLIYLGSIGKAQVPASYYAGITIIGLSTIWLIAETTIKILKIKKTQKNLTEILKKTVELSELEKQNLEWKWAENEKN